MRLDKLLANMGYGSRKEVKKGLKGGGVTVNGEVIKDGKVHIDPELDTVQYQGMDVEYKKHIYLMMNKPPGYISATEDVREKTVIDLLEAEYRMFNPFPVGRLDKDTEGLLLLTNDGQLAHALLSPNKHVPKTYYAQVQGKVMEEDVRAFREGVLLDDGYTTRPAELHLLQSALVSEVEIILEEGKFHQVKRMFRARGKKVIYLKRTQMGGLSLDADLNPGEYRELVEEEVSKLRSVRGEGMSWKKN